MGLRKCPRCELNYIRDDEQLCNVCKRHMKGEAETDDVVTICTECGENPAVRGSELCAMCLREARRQENLEKRADDLTGSSVVDDMDGIDELEVPIDDDIPEIELEEIDKELGGDSNLGSDDMDDMDEENKEEDGETETSRLLLQGQWSDE